jgi:hypothetical protein
MKLKIKKKRIKKINKKGGEISALTMSNAKPAAPFRALIIPISGKTMDIINMTITIPKIKGNLEEPGLKNSASM